MNLSKKWKVNQSKHAQVTQNLFPKFGNHIGYLRLSWGAHKELDLSRSQTSPNDHQDLVQFSTIRSPQRRGQYKLSEVHHNLGDSQTTLVHLGDKSPRITNTRRSSIKCLAWWLSWSLKRVTQISPRKLRLEWCLREIRFELKRECFKVFASEVSDQMSWGGIGALL
jgi:hypothetical protein